MFGTIVKTMNTRTAKAYVAASSVVQQALGSVRTVAAYGQEEAVVREYDSTLEVPDKVCALSLPCAHLAFAKGVKTYVVQAAIWQGTLSGATVGAGCLVIYGSFGLCLWYGSLR